MELADTHLTISLDPAQSSPVGGEGTRERMISILLAVAESMTSGDGVQAALNRLASLALIATGADRCAILVLDREQMLLLPGAGASRTGDPARLWKLFRNMDPIDITADSAHAALWNSSGAVTLDDATASSLLPHNWRAVWKSKSIAFAPLRAGGDTYGLLAVDYVWDFHPFSSEEAQLLEAISSAAGVALQSARLIERLQRQVEVERRLAECTAAVRSGHSLNEVLNLVVDSFSALLPGVSCSINLLSPDRQSILPAAYRGIPPSRDVLSISDLPLSQVAEVETLWKQDPGRAIVLTDLASRLEWRSVIPPNIDVGMLLPLVADEGVIGFLAAGRQRTPFSKEEVHLASSFADQASIAVAQARLTEMIQTRLKVIEALHRLSDVVVSTSDLKALITALNRQVCRDLGLEIHRVTFADTILANLLRAPEPDQEEQAILRAWTKQRPAHAVLGSRGQAIPVPMRNRPAGILWVRSDVPTDLVAAELISSLAAGLGEVASKARLRSLAERRSLELAVANDRERIARDLHDTVGQVLYGIGLKLQDALEGVTDPALASKLMSLKEFAARGVSDVRSAVYALSFLHVRAKGFVSSLRQLAKQFEVSSGVHAEVRIHGRTPSIASDIEGALYRVAHEALVNVDRHSRATGVVLTLESKDSNVLMTIQDDGVGIDQRQARDWQSMAHFGMRMMAKSVNEIGGNFVVRSVEPRGLQLQVTVPIRRR